MNISNSQTCFVQFVLFGQAHQKTRKAAQVFSEGQGSRGGHTGAARACTRTQTSANSPRMVLQKVTVSFCDAPTSNTPSSGENLNIGPNGVLGGTIAYSHTMSPLLTISISYLANATQQGQWFLAMPTFVNTGNQRARDAPLPHPRDTYECVDVTNTSPMSMTS